MREQWLNDIHTTHVIEKTKSEKRTIIDTCNIYIKPKAQNLSLCCTVGSVTL
jgi:hypothetical protein